MKRHVRKAVIQRIAQNKQVSFAVASHIYACKTIQVKQQLCAEEEKRRTLSQCRCEPNLKEAIKP